MEITVIDGQGGRIGSSLIEALKNKGCRCGITAVGTNTAATASMMKSGADRGATGENPVVVACRNAEVIAGPMGIIAANSLLGEITPAMALAVSESGAHKVLIPVSRCGITVAGVRELTINEYIEFAADEIMALCAGK